MEHYRLYVSDGKSPTTTNIFCFEAEDDDKAVEKVFANKEEYFKDIKKNYFLSQAVLINDKTERLSRRIVTRFANGEYVELL